VRAVVAAIRTLRAVDAGGAGVVLHRC